LERPASRRADSKIAAGTGGNIKKPSLSPAHRGLYNLLGEKRLEFIEKRHPRRKMLHAFFWVIISASFCVHFVMLAIMAVRFLSVPAAPPPAPRIIMRFHQEERLTEHVGEQMDKPEIDRAAIEREMAEKLLDGIRESEAEDARSGGEDDKPASNPREMRPGDELKLPNEIDPMDYAPSFGKPRKNEPAEHGKKTAEAADVKVREKNPPEDKPVERVDRKPIDPTRDPDSEEDPLKKRELPEKEGNETGEDVFSENLPRPKPLSFTEWCKELAQTPVHGLGGGAGKPVVPNSGSPRFFGQPLNIDGKSIIFVVDRSASMILESKPFYDLDGRRVRGTKLDRAKAELKRAVAALAEDTKYNIIFFSQFNRKWRMTPVGATPVEKDAAFKFIDQIRHGEQTDTSGAVIEALMAPGNRHIILLSDGWPNILGDDTSPGDKSKKHLERIRRANMEGIRIDTFGFGVDDRGRKFLVTLASDNNGVYTEIESMEEE
jgi:hypothetical protein